VTDAVAEGAVGAQPDRAGAAVEVLGGRRVAVAEVGCVRIGQVDVGQLNVRQVAGVGVEGCFVVEQLLVVVEVLLYAGERIGSSRDRALGVSLAVLGVRQLRRQ
jgi:hypothetical protein